MIRMCLFWQGTPPVCVCDRLNVCVRVCNLFSCFLVALNSESVKQDFAFQLGNDTLILCYKGNVPFVLLCKFLFRNSRWLGCSQDLEKLFSSLRRCVFALVLAVMQLIFFLVAGRGKDFSASYTGLPMRRWECTKVWEETQWGQLTPTN